MRRKTAILIIRATNLGDCTSKYQDMSKKLRDNESISIKSCPTNELYQRKKNDTQKYCMCRRDRDETVHYIINECSRVAKTWVGGKGDPVRIVQETKVLPRRKYYRMPEKLILSDFEIQTGHIIPVNRPDLELLTRRKELVTKWILLFERTKELK